MLMSQTTATVILNYGIKERKKFVHTISVHTGNAAIYAGAPKYTYTIGEYLVDKAGNLSYPSDADYEKISQLVSKLRDFGYEVKDSDISDSTNPHNLVVEIPNNEFSHEAIDNLQKIIASKESVFKKALGSSNLDITITENKLSFPWFTFSGDIAEANAYVQFVCALCNMAKSQKRVTAKEQSEPVENEKFIMRLFLVRLDFKGEDYKIARKVLLSNLSGNGSWRYGQPPKKAHTSKENKNIPDHEGIAH